MKIKKLFNILIIFCVVPLIMGLFQSSVVANENDFDWSNFSIIPHDEEQNSQDEILSKEKSLEIEWNKWRAKVANIIYDNKYCVSQLYKKASFAYSFYVDNNQKLSNITVYYFPSTTVNVDEKSPKLFWISQGEPFYAYSLEHDTFFELRATKTIKINKDKLADICRTAKVATAFSSKLPRAQYMKQSANNIRRLEIVFRKALVFPEGSKRTKVLVTALYRTSSVGSDYSPESFNDTEIIKMQVK